MIIAKLNSKTKLNIIIQSIGMFVGTATHLHWIIQNGFFSENYKAPFFSMLFWDGLVFLDPIAAILLIFRPKTGLCLTAIIIIVDVLHNGIVCFSDSSVSPHNLIKWMEYNWMLLTQFVFGLFVVLSLKININEINFRLYDCHKSIK